MPMPLARPPCLDGPIEFGPADNRVHLATSHTECESPGVPMTIAIIPATRRRSISFALSGFASENAVLGADNDDGRNRCLARTDQCVERMIPIGAVDRVLRRTRLGGMLNCHDSAA